MAEILAELVATAVVEALVGLKAAVDGAQRNKEQGAMLYARAQMLVDAVAAACKEQPALGAQLPEHPVFVSLQEVLEEAATFVLKFGRKSFLRHLLSHGSEAEVMQTEVETRRRRRSKRRRKKKKKKEGGR